MKIRKIDIDEACARRIARWLYLLREHELEHLEHAERQGSWDLKTHYADRARLLHQLLMAVENSTSIKGTDKT